LIAADAARLESMMPAARGLAKTSNINMRLEVITMLVAPAAARNYDRNP
jgi:hypothetical protein